MTKKETFTDEVLRKIRGTRGSEPHERKRKTSRIIVVIDILLVILILLYFMNRGDRNETYHTSSLVYKDLRIRSSINSDTESSRYLVSVSMTSESNKKIRLRFATDKPLAELAIVTNNTVITKESISIESSTLLFEPNESRTFIARFDMPLLDTFASQHEDLIIPKRKSLIQFEKRHIPLKVRIRLNFVERSLQESLNFTHRVEL